MVPDLSPKPTCLERPFLNPPVLATSPCISDVLAPVLSEVTIFIIFLCVVSFQYPFSKLWTPRGQEPPFYLLHFLSLSTVLGTHRPSGNVPQRDVSGWRCAELPAPKLTDPLTQRMPDTVDFSSWEWGGRLRWGWLRALLDSVLPGRLGRGHGEYSAYAGPGLSQGPASALKAGLAQSRAPHGPQAVIAANLSSMPQEPSGAQPFPLVTEHHLRHELWP